MSEEHLENDEEESIPEESEEELPQDAALASDAEDPEAASRRSLGVERWVQIGFIGVALLLVWLAGHVINSVWYIFQDPSETIVTVASVIVGVLGAMALYRHEPSHGLAKEITEELSKVSWPTRKETSNSAVVVVVTSIVTAIMLFVFDTIWSAVTDLVYKV
jgi:preprotein translocase subunit SecE